MSEYPTDEFDNPPAGAPVGVHRKPLSKWRPVLPFLIVLVAVPLLAWAFSEFLMTRSEDTTAASGAVEEVVAPVATEPPAQSSDEVAAPPDALPTEEEAPSVVAPEEPAADEAVNFDASIEVVNVAGVDGWGGQTVGQLNEAGFTNAVADNLDWSPSAVNAIRYQTAADEAAALKIGEVLGITDIALDEAASNTHAVTVFMVAQ